MKNSDNMGIERQIILQAEEELEEILEILAKKDYDCEDIVEMLEDNVLAVLRRI